MVGRMAGLIKFHLANPTKNKSLVLSLRSRGHHFLKWGPQQQRWLVEDEIKISSNRGGRQGWDQALGFLDHMTSHQQYRSPGFLNITWFKLQLDFIWLLFFFIWLGSRSMILGGLKCNFCKYNDHAYLYPQPTVGN